MKILPFKQYPPYQAAEHICRLHQAQQAAKQLRQKDAWASLSKEDKKHIRRQVLRDHKVLLGSVALIVVASWGWAAVATYRLWGP